MAYKVQEGWHERMRILLIRHGESTGNRDHIWAGITDSELTVHGFEQAKKLATHLAKAHDQANVRAIFCSDLIRARRTAQAVADSFHMEVTQTKLLREQDLGWREGLSFKDGDRAAPENASKMQLRPGESKADMDVRADTFIKDYLSTHISSQEADNVVVVVSHGLFLLRLYYRLASHLGIDLPPSVAWSNTGCTQILCKNGTWAVTDVNGTEHLKGLKRVRGVGSTQYDTKQKKVSDFFSGKRYTKHESSDQELASAIAMIDAACDK